MPITSANPLDDIAALRFPGNARTQRYLAAFDHSLDVLLREAGDELPSAPILATGDPRTITNGAGYLAFQYACPGLAHQGDPRLLAGVRAIIADVLAHQRPTGELSASGTAGVERPTTFPPHPLSSHGQSWYLEPILFALVWLRDALAPDELERYERALYLTADFLAARPVLEVNNRGVIVCSILALCGHYFHEPRFIDQARRYFHHTPVKVFDTVSGQIFEGSGPDGNYSGTTYEYLYIYRVFSGDVSIDDNMVAALKWYARVMDHAGHQTFIGASTRMPFGNSASKLHDILPALERYSAREPYFQQLIEQWLPLLEQGHLGRRMHSVSPTIWALLEHAGEIDPGPVPAWCADMRSWYHSPKVGPEHYGYNEGYDSLYFPVRQQYSTSVAIRSRAPLKDLQVWSLAGEPPVIHPAREAVSRTIAWGIDTACMNASGIKCPDFCWVEHERAPGLIVRWEALWRFYIFAPRTTLLLTAGDFGRLKQEWAVDTAICGTPEWRDGALRYPGRRGALHAPVEPEATTVGDALLFTFRHPNTPAWAALSDDSFELVSLTGDTLVWRDADATWQVVFTPADGPVGNFPHSQQHRLQVTAIG